MPVITRAGDKVFGYNQRDKYLEELFGDTNQGTRAIMFSRAMRNGIFHVLKDADKEAAKDVVQ